MTRRIPSATRQPIHRRFPWRAIPLLSLAAAVPSMFGQMHHVAPKERVTRAIGVYEWTGELDKPKAARLVPLTLFINGKFEDAGVYLARPVPFALETGDLYSIEKAGQAQGMFTLDHVRKVVPTMDPNADLLASSWYAYGKFVPPKPEPKAPVLHESAKKPVITSSADKSAGTESNRPHFNNRSADNKPSSDSSATKDSTTTKSSDADKSAPTSSTSSKTANPDSPVLHRSGDSSTQSTTDSQSSKPVSSQEAKPAQDSKSSSASDDSKTSKDTSKDSDSADSKSKDNDIDRPTLRKRDPAADAQRRKAASQSGVSGPEVSLNDDPDRPTMRHGAPPGATQTNELTGVPADMQQAAAVSDPANREPHVFAREWDSPTERTDTLAKLAALAKPLVSAYVTTNQLALGASTTPTTTVAANTASAPNASPATDDESGPKLQRGVPKAYQTPKMAKPDLPVAPAKATAKTATKTTGIKSKTTRASAAKATVPVAPLVLTNEQLIPYTLSYGGLPTFVYSAQADVKVGGPVYVTLVTQRLVSGDMQVALSSVTDASHLNRTPWMRPVDAVDPDVSHRASLLFELRAQSTRQFALYRLTSAKAEQTFATGILP